MNLFEDMNICQEGHETAVFHKSKRCPECTRVSELALLRELAEAARKRLSHLRSCSYDTAFGDEGDFCTCGLREFRAALRAIDELREGKGK